MRRIVLDNLQVIRLARLDDVTFASGPQPWRNGSLFYAYVGHDSEDDHCHTFCTESEQEWSGLREGQTCRVVLETD